MSSPVQLTGGAFQDLEGNVLANGYLKMKLSQDGNVGGVNICSGIEITIQLNSSGNVVTSPAQSVWGNDVISPVNTFYRVTGYTAQGQPVWGPNNQQVTGSGTFDLGTWIPNQVISWTPSTNITLETNGTLNSSQLVLNLEAGSNVTLTDTGGGAIQIAASGGGGGGLSAVYSNGVSIEDTVLRVGSGTLDGTGHLVITFTGAATLNNSFTYSVTCSYQNNSGSETKPLVAFCNTSASTLDVKGDASKGFSFIVFADGTSS